MAVTMRNPRINSFRVVLLMLLRMTATAAGAIELVTNGGFEQNGGANTSTFLAFGVDQVSIDATIPVPTLSEWGLIALGSLSLAIGFVALRRRGANALRHR